MFSSKAASLRASNVTGIETEPIVAGGSCRRKTRLHDTSTMRFAFDAMCRSRSGDPC